MSMPTRLVKGTGLTLGTVSVTILGQVAGVPIYLSYWDTQTFGVWLIFQSMLGYLILMSTAFQQYSYAEMLQRGPADGDGLRSVYQSSLAFGYLIAAIEFAAVLGFGPWAIANMLGTAVDGDTFDLSITMVTLLTLYSLAQMILMPYGAITGYALSVHGRFPRVAAWGLLHAALVLLAPALAVVMGGDLMIAGLALIIAHTLAGTLSMLDTMHLARGHQLLIRQAIAWRMGARNALFCLPLAGRGFIDSFRQQGFRVVLGAYAGPVAVTTLATTRTFANVLHQGLSTITAPLLPELMRYVVDRDQDRVEGAFAIVWLCVFALLVPGVLVLCAVAEPVFLIWTRGAVRFDGVLFLSLLIVVLLYAASQPTAAILQGQNRIIWMLSASVGAAVALIVFTIVLVPLWGLRGAGYALIAAELCAMAFTVIGASRTLRKDGLAFPLKSFGLVLANIATVFGLSLQMVAVLEGQAAAFLLPLAANAFFVALYWRTIPLLARKRIADVGADLQARFLRRRTV